MASMRKYHVRAFMQRNQIGAPYSRGANSQIAQLREMQKLSQIEHPDDERQDQWNITRKRFDILGTNMTVNTRGTDEYRVQQLSTVNDPMDPVNVPGKSERIRKEATRSIKRSNKMAMNQQYENMDDQPYGDMGPPGPNSVRGQPSIKPPQALDYKMVDKAQLFTVQKAERNKEYGQFDTTMGTPDTYYTDTETGSLARTGGTTTVQNVEADRTAWGKPEERTFFQAYSTPASQNKGINPYGFNVKNTTQNKPLPPNTANFKTINY